MNDTCIFCGKPCNELFHFGQQPFSTVLASDFVTLQCLKLLHCSNCDLVQSNRNLFQFDERYQYHTQFNKLYREQTEFFYKAYLQGRKKDFFISDIGCNDGTLLSIFRKLDFTNTFGFEPVSHLANKAVEASLSKVIAEPFSLSSFGRVPKADLLILNHTFHCLQNLNEIVEALRLAIKSDGRLIIEVPDFEYLVKNNAWDFISHESMSYFTQSSMLNIMSKYFAIEAVHELEMPMPSKRYIFIPKGIPDYTFKKETYSFDVGAFQRMITFSKLSYLETLIQWKKMHRLEIAAFGATSKANSFFNFLGLDRDVISYCVDDTPGKWGKLMPKSNIPILSFQKYEALTKKPDIMLITPWTMHRELKDKIKHPACWIKNSNGEFKRV